jgi:peptide/nickel transport system ATP-binding protein
MIAVDGLVVSFGDDDEVKRAVDGIGFRVREGETFGLVGESGCGKSTVLRVLAGLNPTYAGRLRIAGREVGPKRDKALMKSVQMVFQDPYGSLHPRQTVNAQLMEPLRIQGLDDAAGRVERALAAVGLGAGFRYRYPHQLSGGQRQRVAIARALVLEPDVLLLDEPTSALDVSVQAEVLNLLADLKAAGGLTYVLVSHDLGVIAHMCDRLAVMTEGRIVEELDVQALVAGAARHPYTVTLLRASETYGEGGVPAAARAPHEAQLPEPGKT